MEKHISVIPIGTRIEKKKKARGEEKIYNWIHRLGYKPKIYISWERKQQE